MKRINKKSIIKFLTITTALMVMFSITVNTVFIDGGLTASAYVTQGQIDRLRSQKQDIERKKREVQTKINAIEFERKTEMAKKTVLDQRIELTSHEIRNVNDTITQLYYLIREKEYEVANAQNREDDQLQRYKSRVRDMEENGIVSYFELLFDSTSFSDMLARIDFVRDIMHADESIYRDLQAAREKTILAKENLEETKSELDEEKVNLESLEEELLEQLDEAHALILKLEADISAENDLRDRYIAEQVRVEREITAAIATLQRQQEEERLRQQQAQSGGGSGGGGGGGGGAVVGSGQLGWPMAGSIISRFGVVRGPGRVHLGLDIGAAYGTNVVAAASGRVTTAKYNEGGLGYYVTIDHGNGIRTVSGHLSSYIVSVGDQVSRGQVIGYNGSSGNANCPHVHFEVFVNGTRVNPLSMM